MSTKLWTVRIILLTTSVFLLGATSVANNEVDDGVGASYWSSSALVFATCESLTPLGTPYADMIWCIRPIGAFSGAFDAGRVSQIHFQPSLYPLMERPKPGDAVLVVLWAHHQADGLAADGFTQGAVATYMPKPYAPLRVVTGFSDRLVGETFEKVKKLRQQDKRYPVRNKPLFVKLHASDYSLVYGEVVEISKPGPASPAPDKIVLRPIRTEAGPVDSSRGALISSRISSITIASKYKLPKVGDEVLASIARITDKAGTADYITPDPVDFMPDDHAPLYIVKDASDANVERTFAAIKSAKHWLTHSLIYAKIKSVSDWKQGKTSREIVACPLLTLSGAFDAAKNPEIKVAATEKLFAAQSPPKPGTMALLLMTRAGGAYSITEERADFMPGEAHNPICSVWEFSDRRVTRTFRAVQELRRKERPPDIKPEKR